MPIVLLLLCVAMNLFAAAVSDHYNCDVVSVPADKTDLCDRCSKAGKETPIPPGL